MTDNAVSLGTLTAWLQRFGELVLAHSAELGEAGGLSAGIEDVLRSIGQARPTTVEELFKTAGMTIVSHAGSSGPFYGTFLLRFGMHAGDVSTLDPEALGGSLRSGVEGVLARTGTTPAVDVLGHAIAAFDAAVAEGLDAAAAASKAVAAVSDPDGSDAAALSARLLLEALASALG